MINFSRCPAVIYDEGGSLIAKAIIVDHDRKTMTVTLLDGLDSVKAGTRLGVLIIHAEGASEFSATARGSTNGYRELAIFNQRSREGRAAPRRRADMPAFIKTLTVGESTRNFRPPFEVFVKNISATGMLINAPEGFFTAGASTEIIIRIGESETLLRGEIVRKTSQPDMTCDFGFKFVTPAGKIK
ncbi:MAG: PilZ domain-containing protein [Oscillospiraceae bacterium]|jgi:hypothetical protein|nr:PilZ domain-containing protein [Oscillospiraceae bacterium]